MGNNRIGMPAATAVALQALLRIQKISAAKPGHTYGPSDYSDLCDDMDAIYGIARNTIRDYPSPPSEQAAGVAAEEQGFHGNP